jgi:transposase-like zinc ribbon protein
MTLCELMVTFADEDGCKQILFERRWPNGVFFPCCGNETVYRSSRLALAACEMQQDGRPILAHRGNHGREH